MSPVQSRREIWRMLTGLYSIGSESMIDEDMSAAKNTSRITDECVELRRRRISKPVTL